MSIKSAFASDILHRHADSMEAQASDIDKRIRGFSQDIEELAAKAETLRSRAHECREAAGERPNKNVLDKNFHELCGTIAAEEMKIKPFFDPTIIDKADRQ